MIQLEDEGGIFLACPNCEVDEYLMDIEPSPSSEEK